MESTTITIRLPKDLKERLRKKAIAEGRTTSELARFLLSKALKKKKG